MDSLRSEGQLIKCTILLHIIQVVFGYNMHPKYNTVHVVYIITWTVFFVFFCMRYTCLCILFSTYCNKHKCSVAFATAIVEIIMLSRLHAAVIVFLVSIHTQPNRILSMKDLI